MRWARQAIEAPAEDVRSRVIGLEVLATVLAANGDRPGAHRAAEQAVTLAYATEQVSERAAAEQIRSAVED